MKRLAALALFMLWVLPVQAAPLVAPCTEASQTAAECDPVNSGNPLPVTTTVKNSSGLGQPLIGCDSSIVYDASTNGSTELVPLTSNQTVYVCGYTIFAAGTVNVELDYGTGTACASGTNKIAPAFQLTAQTGAVDGAAFFRGLKTIASNALCLKTSAGVAVQAIVYYSKF